MAWKVMEAHESRGAVRGLLKPVHLVQEFASECEGSGARLHGDRLPPVCGSGGSRLGGGSMGTRLGGGSCVGKLAI